MGNRLKKLKKIKKIRLHHEGVNTLIIGAICLVLFNAVLFYAFPGCIPVYIVAGISVVIYLILVNSIEVHLYLCSLGNSTIVGITSFIHLYLIGICYANELITLNTCKGIEDC